MQTAKPIKIGAGGQVTTFDISPDGTTRVISTDTSGAYIQDTTTGQWQQLITISRMPGTDVGVGLGMNGAYETRCAPSDPTVIYMSFTPSISSGAALGYLFKSTDRGASFSRTAFSSYACNPNPPDYKFFGPKMAVDPGNKDIVYICDGPGGHDGAIFISSHTTGSPGVNNGANTFVGNEPIQFSVRNGGTLPAGYSARTTYYVMSTGLTTGHWSVSASPNNVGPVTTTTSGTSERYATQGAGVYVSSNGGTSFSLITDIPFTFEHPHCIAYDPNSETVGDVKQGIYVHVPGIGVYHSTNGGTSFSLISGGPDSFPNLFYASHIKVATDGTVYVTVKTDSSSTSALWRYSSSTWTNIKANMVAGANPETIVVDPSGSNPALVLCAVDGGPIHSSANHGDTFTAAGTVTRTAPNIPWFGVANETYMTIGDMVMDTQAFGKIWFAEGIGAWYSTTNNAWIESAVGIENMIYQHVISPPNSVPIICCSDRAFFTITNPDAYIGDYGPNKRVSIEYGSDADWASMDPKFIVGVDVWNGEDSSYSSDGGVHWSTWPANPGMYATGHPNGCIAASTALNWVYIPSNRGDVYFTLDGGKTWTKVDAANFKTSGGGATGMINAPGETGWPFAYYLNAHCVVADRVTPNKFYAHNWQTAVNGGGLYVSTDGGLNWTRQSTALTIDNMPSAYNNKLISIPNLSNSGTGGHLLFTCGVDIVKPLQYSPDAGITWNAAGTGANATSQINSVGCGAVKSGNDWPSVYIAGKVNGVYGIYQSDNSKAEWATVSGGVCTAVTWTQIDTFPLGSPGKVNGVSGDSNVWGRCYVATNNGGCFYYGEERRYSGLRLGMHG